jgi:hypothetical protein
MLAPLAVTRAARPLPLTDRNPSIVPAITSSTTTAPIILIAMWPLATTASARDRSPGTRSDLPSRNPAAPRHPDGK